MIKQCTGATSYNLYCFLHTSINLHLKRNVLQPAITHIEPNTEVTLYLFNFVTWYALHTTTVQLKWKTCQRKNPPIAFHIYRTRYSDLMYTTRVALQQLPNVFSLNEQVMRDTSTRLTTSLLFKHQTNTG